MPPNAAWVAAGKAPSPKFKLPCPVAGVAACADEVDGFVLEFA